MPKQFTLVLVVAKPRHLWNGMQSLLRTIPQIEVIAEIRDPAILLKMGAEMQPDLALLDASLFGEEILMAITKIRGGWPTTRCVVLTENDLQRQSAQDAGADLVVPEGFTAAKLVTLIEDLLSQRENDTRIEPDSKSDRNE